MICSFCASSVEGAHSLGSERKAVICAECIRGAADLLDREGAGETAGAVECSFCIRSAEQAGRLIGGVTQHHICDRCIRESLRFLEFDENREVLEGECDEGPGLPQRFHRLLSLSDFLVAHVSTGKFDGHLIGRAPNDSEYSRLDGLGDRQFVKDAVASTDGETLYANVYVRDRFAVPAVIPRVRQNQYSFGLAWYGIYRFQQETRSMIPFITRELDHHEWFGSTDRGINISSILQANRSGMKVVAMAPRDLPRASEEYWALYEIDFESRKATYLTTLEHTFY